MLTRIRNAIKVKEREVLIIKTNLTLNICKILKQEGFIESFEVCDPAILIGKNNVKNLISIKLKYKVVRQESYITNIKRISKPGLRVYSSSKNIPKVLGGIGTAVFAKIQ